MPPSEPVDLPTLPVSRGQTLPLDPHSDSLATPAILVDLDVVDANISGMQRLADHQGVALRPHAKSHKSLAIAHRQLAAGAQGVCVATVGEAEVMHAGGVNDITVAYPIVGRAKVSRLVPLLRRGTTRLVTDSVDVSRGYSEAAQTAGVVAPLLIEIDSGMHRTGVRPDDAGQLASAVASLPGLAVEGILTHAGHAHDPLSQIGMAVVARQEAAAMQVARQSILAEGIEIQTVSAGSTLTAPYLSATDGITEIRPGTYVYNDLRTLDCYACTIDRIAVRVLTTVVSRGDSFVVLDAGNKTLTMTHTEQHGFGYPVSHPNARITRLSEEHAVLSIPEGPVPPIGTRLELLPIHVCVCMDLQHEIYGTRSGSIVERIRVDAMRRSL